MVLLIFGILLAIFVIIPLVGWAVWFFISAAVSGIILGGLARLIIPGRQPIGILATIVSGWIGSLIGGAIGVIALGRHHHFGTVLIEIGVSAVAVLAWSAVSRNSALETGNRRVIDV